MEGGATATKAVPRWRVVLRWYSAFFAVLIGSIYLWRPDFAAALTLYPLWIWPLIGLTAALAFRSLAKKAARIGVVSWLALTAALVEEPRSIFRTGPRINAGSLTADSSLRVITLNCGGGSHDAAAEALALKPDLLLLQETPSLPEVARLADVNKLSYHVNGDGSILAKGKVEAVSLPKEAYNFALARVTFANGNKVLVASLRLRPPVFRIDLYNPACWRIQRHEREARRTELQRVLKLIAQRRKDEPLIVAGDFNAPAGDAVYRELPAELEDTFAQAGRGFCNTAINQFPFARIDQIWISNGLQAKAHGARRTENSDHRMVVADLAIR